MQAYPTATAQSNHFPVLSYRAPSWTYEQSARITRSRNPRYSSTKGVRRRDRAEFRVGDVLTWIAALVHGRDGARTNRGDALVITRGLYTRLGHCTPGIWDLRTKIRARVSWLVANGPVSGWAVRPHGEATETKSKLTPWYIPTRSRAAAEVWARFARDTYRLVRLFAALLSKLRPAQRSPERTPQRQEPAKPVPTGEERDSTGCRSQSPPERGGPPRSLAQLLDDVRRKYGEGARDARD